MKEEKTNAKPATEGTENTERSEYDFSVISVAPSY
jgi:hypothetical protein